MTTPIGFIIQPGQSIPDDVTGFAAADGEDARRADGLEYGEWAHPGCGPQCIGHKAKEFKRPLTVTAVREQPAEPDDSSASGLCEVGADRVTCIVADADHRRIYHGGSTLGDVATTMLAAEPAPDVLDLVRQYGAAKDAAAASRVHGLVEPMRESAKAAADLLARIEAEVQRLLGEVARLESDNERLKRFRDADEKAVLQVIGERDENQEWADRLAQAIAEYLRIDIGEHSNMNLPWQAALIALTDAVSPSRPDPLVLSLPQVPEGAVALVGVESGIRYPRRDGTVFWLDPGRGNATTALSEVLEIEDSVTVVMREPRTWPKISSTEDEPGRVEVDGHGRWHRSRGTDIYVRDNGVAGMYSLADLRELGDVTEVFDDEDGTR